MSESIPAEISSGNVFADLGFDNPEEELLSEACSRNSRHHQAASSHPGQVG